MAEMTHWGAKGYGNRSAVARSTPDLDQTKARKVPDRVLASGRSWLIALDTLAGFPSRQIETLRLGQGDRPSDP